MIEIKNISKTYGTDTLAVDDLSLTIKDGQIVGFIGPNGAGKTTTLKMLTGILKPDNGEITINGHNIVNDPIITKKQFGFVSDNPNIYPKLRGREYLNFIGDMYEVDYKMREEQINHYAKLLKMEESLDDKIATYSHGMRQKIMVIAVLIHDPYLLILDEPLTGLDPQSSFVLKALMKERAAEGKSVFFSTHVLEVAEKLCDQIAIIDHGRLIYHGTLDNLKNQYPELSLEEIFLRVTIWKKYCP